MTVQLIGGFADFKNDIDFHFDKISEKFFDNMVVIYQNLKIL